MTYVVTDQFNATYAPQWPVIDRKNEPPADAEAWEDVKEKFETEFDPNPGGTTHE